jgi:uroporphyrin-III C-methyltransferase/precorrin-2 dehydrogenase/sirohydrochlorin ferrochelatase
MRYFPLFLDLRGRTVVVVGGGTIAERKLDLVREAGPRLVVVAPDVTPRLAALAREGALEHRARTFEPADLDGARFVIAATDDRDVNRAVADAADARGLPANVVDDLELSTGILPAIVDRSPVVIAISTQGTTPALARLIRERVESLVDESFGRLAAFCERWRGGIKARVRDLAVRRRLYDWLLRGEVADLVRHGREDEAARVLDAALAQVGAGLGAGDPNVGGAPAAAHGSLPAGAAGPLDRGGSVTLVGAGPGDPGLLTLNALRALQSADVVLHDRLVSPEILRLARREAELIEVGKSGDRSKGHSVAQGRIHELLLLHARAGRRVVRLKGGDPFVFGRGGEELEALREAGIRYEVVPGITAALACGAYAGIPLTHREHSASLRIVTAHCRESVEATDWRGLAGARETLAVYMGVAMLGTLERELVRHGRSPATPVALVENGSRREQRVVVGTLGGVEALAARERVQSPALLVVGDVAALATRLHWFGAPPVVDAAARAVVHAEDVVRTVPAALSTAIPATAPAEMPDIAPAAVPVAARCVTTGVTLRTAERRPAA